MLSDAFGDFTYLVKEPDADLPKLLAELEDDLSEYSKPFWRYDSRLFPLLRKAARWYVAGKLSWRALNPIDIRLQLHFLGHQEEEGSLVNDLRDYIRLKPTIDLRTKVGRICRLRRTTRGAPTGKSYHPITATTTTGVVLTLVR